MLIKNIILKKSSLINKNKRNTVFLKKKNLYLILFIWLKIIKQNNFLIKYNNIKKLLYFTLQILSLKVKKKFTFFFSYLPINLKSNYITSLVSYVIKITFLKSNIHINITNIYGSTLIACSSGIIKLRGSQKTRKLAYNRIIKFTKFKIRKLTNKIFAIHFIGTKLTKKKLLKSFKKYFCISNIKHFNLIAHNGCRLKK